MKKHLIAIAAAVVVGVICWRLTQAAPFKPETVAEFLAVVMGAATEIIVFLFQDRNESKDGLTKLEERQKELVEILKERIDRDEKVHELLQYVDQELPKEKMMETWLDLLTQLRRTYCATNYTVAGSVYGSDWGAAALLIQNAKKKAYDGEVIIKKVFLIDDNHEMAAVSERLDEQKKIGVQIHYLPRQELYNNQKLSAQLKAGEIPSLDFGILDEDIVLVWELKEDRDVAKGRVLVGRKHASKHKEFFDALYEIAEEFNRKQNIVVVELEEVARDIIDRWPEYMAPYEKMTPVLRSPGGWLDTFHGKPGSNIYAAYDDGSLVGFSILACNNGEAEFRVAIHPERVNNISKYGTQLTRQTLRKGFDELLLRRIELRLFKPAGHVVRMFEKAGFKAADGTNDVLVMVIEDRDYRTRHPRPQS